jgi:hypothetical protein
MRNWSTDTTRLKNDPRKYQIWRLEQQLNFGLEEGEKLDWTAIEKNLSGLKIDQDTRNFLKFILYGEKPTNQIAT